MIYNSTTEKKEINMKNHYRMSKRSGNWTAMDLDQRQQRLNIYVETPSW